MWLLRISLASLWNRRLTSALSILSFAFAVSLFLSVETLRKAARESFTQTISGTSLVVGARSSPLQLLLYSVFHLGNPIANISYSAFESIKKNPSVEWSIPLSLGDSHRGYRVVATNQDLFKYFQFRKDHKLEFRKGQPFSNAFEVVLGSELEERLHYDLETKIVLSHGVSDSDAIYRHEETPFRVVGILKPTRTPIDRGLYISLEDMDRIHEGWKDGSPPDLDPKKTHHSSRSVPKPESITSFLLRTKAPQDILRLQREILDRKDEALMAVLPGVALSELWSIVSSVEDVLKGISFLVMIVGLLSLLMALLTGIEQRRRELAILRSLGVGIKELGMLLAVEAFLLSLSGILLSLMVVYGGLHLALPQIEDALGMNIHLHGLGQTELIYMLLALACGLAVGIISAIRAQKLALQDGLSARL